MKKEKGKTEVRRRGGREKSNEEAEDKNGGKHFKRERRRSRMVWLQ